jgi:3-methyladenine DNA glycosylase AlkD
VTGRASDRIRLNESKVTLALARRRLRDVANPEDAVFLQRFFKTGPGDYGEGDQFLGIRVPTIRRLARELRSLSLDDIEALLQDPSHEARHLALILLVDSYAHGTSDARGAIVSLYLRNTRWINNWDLVDVSAAGIVGAHLMTRSRRPLDRLARSSSVWERRIAIIATHRFIKAGQFDDTLRIAEALMGDSHDLIQKAVGWMLREVGERDRPTLERFLDARAREMPRTMLRYAIEKLSAVDRHRFMSARPARKLTR